MCFFKCHFVFFFFYYFICAIGKSTKYKEQNNTLDKMTKWSWEYTQHQYKKRVSWHRVLCNLLLMQQRCREKFATALLYGVIFAGVWQASVWVCHFSLSFREQRSRRKHWQRQRWQRLWQRLRLLQTEWRWWWRSIKRGSLELFQLQYTNNIIIV